MFNNIVWTSESFTLRQFVEEFTLPQIVMVDDGIYNKDETTTLSTGQILTLHFTKRTDKVVAKVHQQKEYLIPVNCPCKVEILPKICEDRYFSVADVLHDFPSFVRVLHNSPPSMGLRAGDILKLKGTFEERHCKFLEFERHNKIHDRVRLPLEFRAVFDPLAEVGEHHLQEVLDKFPVRVKFTSSNTLIKHENRQIDLQKLGSVILKAKRQESIVIASSRDGSTVSVLTVPVDLDVTIRPALGAINGDRNYARFCRNIHDGARLEKVENLQRFQLYDADDDADADLLYEYEEVKPIVPLRGPHPRRHQDSDELLAHSPSSRPLTPPNDEFAESSDSDGYEYVDLPPPAPVDYRSSMMVRENVHCKDGLRDVPTSPTKEKGTFPPADEPTVSPLSSYSAPVPIPQQTSRTTCDTGHNKHSWISSIRKRLLATPGTGRSCQSENSIPTQDSRGSSVSPTSRGWPENQQLLSVSKAAMETSPPVPQRDASLSPSSDSPSFSGFPENLESLSVSEVGDCLRKLNMAEHLENFTKNQVDGMILKEFNDDMLNSLGVVNKLQKKKLMMFIHEGYRPKL